MFRPWTLLEVSWPRDTAAALGALAGDGEIAWLDSASAAAARASTARYSLICADPLATIEQFDRRPAQCRVAGRLADAHACGWQLWRSVRARLPRWACLHAPLSPGWVGYVGFEMARHLERLPHSHDADLGLPLMRLSLFDRGVLLDHLERRAFLVAGTGLCPALGLRERPLEPLIERWEAVARLAPAPARVAPAVPHFDMDRPVYDRMITRALDYIAAGDIYQVNLAQRLRLAGVGDPLDAYRVLRGANPAPYGALLRWPGGAVLSASPELFLRLRGCKVLTSPIKGTRPRTGDVVLDAAYRRQLLASEKEAAELTMIVDLHRNDLGRVCEFGSVRVRRARRLEAHPTVLHTVADVVGRLRPDRDALDLLAACFPAGSISGVPKIRALEIIDELEPVARGVYTGAIGVLGLDGQMTFSVAIRTLQFCGGTATLYVGGGIVADSDPAAEYEETLAKARGIVAALCGAAAEPSLAGT